MEFDWRYYLRSVLRHKRLVVATVVAGLGLGILASRFLTPTYAARANLWVETAKDGGGNPGPTWSNQLLGSTGWIDLLRSDLIVVDAVQKQRLYLLPHGDKDAAALATFTTAGEYRPGIYTLEVDDTGEHYTLTSKDGGVAQQGVVGDSVGRTLGFVWKPDASVLSPGSRVRFEVLSLYAATEKLLEVLDIRPGRDRNFIRIDLRGSNPELTAATVNTMAEHLVRLAAELKRQKLTELTAILGEQLRQAESNLRQSEEMLKGFKARNAPLMVPESQTLPTGFLATRVEQENLALDREAIAEVLAAADSGASLHALARVGAVQRMPDLSRALEDLTTKEAELRALQRRYTEEHPAVQQATIDVDGAQTGIRTLAKALMTNLATNEQRLAERVVTATESLREVSPLSVEEARLGRDVRVAEELFIALRRRYEEARLADLSTTPDVRILDAARPPEEPLYNHAPLVIVLALVGSFGLGVMLAVALDLFDPKVRYPAQVTHDLGLPLLGVVPHVPPRSAKDENGLAPVIEALRGVRFNALHAYGAAGPVLLTVTSPGMGDGKSFITSNLALAFADARYRTLLVDGDIRRGSLHRILNVSRKPGLTDFLSGDADRESIIQHTAYTGLSFIGAGARRRAGPELLSSPALARLFTDLRSKFDVIIVDSSPLAAGIDPYALGTLTGNLVLVLRTGVTNRELAGAKLDLLGRLPIRVLGTIINDVRPGADNQYSYYMAGYELEEEVTAANGAGRRILPLAEVGAASVGGDR
jgi:capsular exopolysaccharide synthesis family protein